MGVGNWVGREARQVVVLDSFRLWYGMSEPVNRHSGAVRLRMQRAWSESRV